MIIFDDDKYKIELNAAYHFGKPALYFNTFNKDNNEKMAYYLDHSISPRLFEAVLWAGRANKEEPKDTEKDQLADVLGITN
jgi:hypothetical protein